MARRCRAAQSSTLRIALLRRSIPAVLVSELSSTSRSSRVTLYVVMTFSNAAAILSTSGQLSAISVAVSSAVKPPKDGMTSPPWARIFAMSGPNVDQATGLVGSPFHRMSQEPVCAVCRNAMVRYLAPEAALCWAGLASVYAWKYGENTWAGRARCSSSPAYALVPRTPPAGATTLVRLLSQLLKLDSGAASIAGSDVVRHPQQVREIIGLSGQYAAVDEYLTGEENLEMIGRLYHLGRTESRARARDLLERFDLTEAAGRPVKTYSGGMRRRLDLAGALVARPPVIFLDEPTTGLDPRSRLGMWDVIGERVRQGATLLLTTQYMEEADQLADDIVVLDRGKAIARGTSDELKARIGGERLEVTLVDRADLGAVTSILKALGTAEPVVDTEARRVAVPVSGGVRALTEAVRQLDTAEIQLADIGVRRPTLDDVFLQLTGHTVSDDEGTTK